MGANYWCGPPWKPTDDDLRLIDARLTALRNFRLAEADAELLREAVGKIVLRVLAELDPADLRSSWWGDFVASALEAACPPAEVPLPVYLCASCGENPAVLLGRCESCDGLLIEDVMARVRARRAA